MNNASNKTSIVGFIIIALDIMKLAGDAIQEGGIPKDINGWIVFVAGISTGIGLILSKDYNVSNSPKPAKATQVSDVNEGMPNPAAVAKP